MPRTRAARRKGRQPRHVPQEKIARRSAPSPGRCPGAGRSCGRRASQCPSGRTGRTTASKRVTNSTPDPICSMVPPRIAPTPDGGSERRALARTRNPSPAHRPSAGGIAARATRRRRGRPPISTGLNPEQRARGRGAGRAGAGAGRRRHRQDARADDPHRPHPVRPAAPRALADPRRHLHQQGGARDEGAHRRAGRRRRRGHALARHLPLHRRQDPAPPCRAGRA